MDITLQPSQDVSTTNGLADGYINQNWWPELKLDMSLQGVAADFYLFYAVKDGDSYLQEKFEEFAQVLAKQIAVYLDAAIGGELRHKSFAGMTKDTNRSIARREWRDRRLREGHTLLFGGRNCFHNSKWKGSFGGPLWGAIADLLCDHLSGKTSTTMFVDTAFGLEHNTGTVFDKIGKYWTQKNLKHVLNANLSQDWEVLLKNSSEWAKEMFTYWLGSEDTIKVEGIEHSRPRIVSSLINKKMIIAGMNAKVQNTTRVRNENLRGQEVIVLYIRPSTMYVQVKTVKDGKLYWTNGKNLEAMLSDDNSPLEYIG